jgi:acetyl-CoA carboxylase/biotin carboxylase 1
MCLPWRGSGTGIHETVTSDGGYVTVPDNAYMHACIVNMESELEKAKQIGRPIMIKASEGGGAKGIGKVENADALNNAVAGEVPGSPILS